MVPGGERQVAEPADLGRHGTAVPRGLDGNVPSSLPAGRFGWLFPDLPACEIGPDEIKALVELMEGRQTGSQNLGVPAGFTYLAQFIDHDITFDPTTLTDRERDPDALVNFRTPRLDLDSLYGQGPVVQPYLYDWDEAEMPGARLLVGYNASDGTPDLPRNQQGRALIGDPRNDEHLIVAQLHLLFIRFHNAVVDRLSRDGTAAGDLFEAARRVVRRHYQWIVVEEFLPKIVGDPAPGIPRTAFAGEFIPFEFSGAAYRFGHSMVRRDYGLKRLPSATPVARLFPDLAGHRRLTRKRVIDWERFFVLDGRRRPQPSMAIDTSIAEPLFHLPEGEPKLPRRTLLRGIKLGLPSGQAVAGAMRQPVLEEPDLLLDEGLETGARTILLRSTPLWYYLLCEAEKGGGEHLGPVGGRIVADVLMGLLEGDPDSFLNEATPWRPGELGTGEHFGMKELIRFVRRAEEGA